MRPSSAVIRTLATVAACRTRRSETMEAELREMERASRQLEAEQDSALRRWQCTEQERAAHLSNLRGRLQARRPLGVRTILSDRERLEHLTNVSAQAQQVHESACDATRDHQERMQQLRRRLVLNEIRVQSLHSFQQDQCRVLDHQRHCSEEEELEDSFGRRRS